MLATDGGHHRSVCSVLYVFVYVSRSLVSLLYTFSIVHPPCVNARSHPSSLSLPPAFILRPDEIRLISSVCARVSVYFSAASHALVSLWFNVRNFQCVAHCVPAISNMYACAKQ